MLQHFKLGTYLQIKDFEGSSTAPASVVANVAASPYFTPLDVLQVYQIPVLSPGIKPTVGIIELGGGYNPTELQTYWQYLGYRTYPTVRSVLVSGGQNIPGLSDDDYEVYLDIQVIGGFFPNGNVNINVYFAPNTVQGFYNAIQQAINDNVNSISISWGAPEKSWATSDMNRFNSLFASAVSKNISVFVASGDSGSEDGLPGLNVDFPASSPNVVACGGTTLVSPNRIYSSKTTSENAWSGSGGGQSSYFAPPSYQISALSKKMSASEIVNPFNPFTQRALYIQFQNSAQQTPTITKRQVPDVAGVADPNTGWIIYLRGQYYVIGGTSAVAPMWSAIWAILTASSGKKYAGSMLYGSTSPLSFHDIVTGNNGAYQAKVGFDMCTGLGTPKGH